MANNIPKDFIDQISDLIEGLIKNANIPIVKSCRIINNNGNGTYTVSRGNETHKVGGNGTYDIGGVVQVLLPDGKWTRAIIIGASASSGGSGGSDSRNGQADWNETDPASNAYIRNKPTKISDFENDGDFIMSEDIQSISNNEITELINSKLID